MLCFRSKEPARKRISTTELHDLSIFADILNDDVMKMTGKISSGTTIISSTLVGYLMPFINKFRRLKNNNILVI